MFKFNISIGLILKTFILITRFVYKPNCYLIVLYVLFSMKYHYLWYISTIKTCNISLSSMYDGCHMWSRNSLPFRSTRFHPGFSVVRVARSLVFCAMSCISLFFSLLYFCWPLGYLSFFDLWLIFTPLVSSNFSHIFCKKEQ
jgi:hypothetical protein